MRVRQLSVVLASFMFVVGACSNTEPGLTISRSGSTGSADSGSDPGTGVSSEIDWQELGDGLEQGTLAVPMDYDDPAGRKIDLFLVRHAATDSGSRIGTLLVNPGGPGVAGSILAQVADGVYSEDLLESFDIVAWDPRGTGRTVPAIDCIDDYDRYYATEYEGLSDDEEHELNEELAAEFANKCEENNGELLDFVGTNNSARDMDSIRRSLGEDTISYFGFSYGSELGATWATLFPETVRAAVLDGAADPDADSIESSLQQTRGFEDSLDAFLTACSADASCPFHSEGDAAAAFDALLDALEEEAIPSESGRPDVGPGVAVSAVVQALYSQATWQQLAEALDDARDGDGSGLLALHDEYYDRLEDGTYDNTLEAFQVIRCADSPERLTVEEADAQAPLFAAAAPRLYGDVTGGSYFCTYFPPSTDPRVDITGAGAGPILVVGTTGDPATPLESSRRMAEALEDGALLVVDAEQHTGYDVNDCSMSTVDRYLIDLEVPADGTTC